MKKHNIQLIALFCIELIILLPFTLVNVFAATDPVEDVEVPFIDAEIPSYINTNEMEIKGYVEPYSKVRLYIDDMIKGQIIGEQTGEEGIFDFGSKYIGEDGTHDIRIWAIDPSENENEVNFVVTVDSEEPVLAIGEIPSKKTDKTLMIKGNVNEDSTINFYIRLGEKDTTAPAKITGLTEDEVKENRISFSWDRSTEEDFDKYIIYREDVGIIGMIGSVRNNRYTDRLVNSGADYSYRVAAMDKAGNTGIKSNPLAVTTLEGGRTDISMPHAVSTAEEPTKTITAVGDFNESFELVSDGTYQIKIEAVDLAGNFYEIDSELLLDTTPPEIEITNPRDRASIYQHYADEVDIEGVTEPNAKVYLYVQRTPLGYINDSFDVYGLPDDILDIPEAELGVGCRLRVGGIDYCDTGADYETTANSNGYFKFDNVALESLLSMAFASREVPIEELDRFGRESLFEEQRRTRKANLVFIATDDVGKRGAEKIYYKIVTCWSGNLTWDIVPLLEYQSPTFLNPERIAEGSEHIYFYLNFSYLGDGLDPEISSINVAPACEGYMENDPRYNFSCRLIPRSCEVRPNPDRTTWYVACRLKALPELNTWTETDWNKFFDSIKSALTHEIMFPFSIRIRYSHKLYGDDISSEYQTACIQTAYAVDDSKIDFRMLPDFLLYDMVDWLGNSINAINKVNEQIRTVLQWTGIGCVAAFALRMGVQIVRRISCSLSDLRKFLETVGGEDGTQDECRVCLDNAKVEYRDEKGDILNRKELGKINLQSKLSDDCLGKCYPGCKSTWDFEAKLYTLYRSLCDRVFCHSSPSKWTKDEGDTELYDKLQTGSVCTKDETMRGHPLRAVKCDSVKEDYSTTRTFDYDDKCFEIYSENKKALYRLGRRVEEGIYEIENVAGPEVLEIGYAIKETEKNYLTANPKSCSDVCGLGVKSDTAGEWVEGYHLEDEEESDEIKKAELVRWECTTTNECRNWNQVRGQVLTQDGAPVENIKAEPKGYTSDCFYDGHTVSDNPNENEECCCVYANKGEENFYYYQPADLGVSSYDEMEWSYRYWKEEYLGKVYNPYRYIPGRDFTACFGQNNILYDGIGTEEGKMLILDPFTQHTSALQCACISGVYNRLMMLNNIMTALRSCLLTVRTTGTADAGVCKELFSQYVCSAIWHIISYVKDGCTPLGSITSETDKEGILTYVKTGLSGVWDSVEDSRSELMEEYGTVQLNNLLGVGEETLARKICLAAFGYDWGFEMKDIIDAAYATPYATLVQAILPSREYLTFTPFGGGKARYDYRSSWIINPGCEIDDYDVYLSCVTRDELDKYPGVNCEKQSDPEGMNCDCLDLENEKLKKFYNGQKLSQGVLEDIEHHYVVEDYYRYDHLKFILKPDRRIREDLKNKCFPDRHSDGIFYFPIKDKTGYDVASCYVDVHSGMFVCPEAARFFDTKQVGYFVDVEINDQKASNDVVVHEGDPLEFESSIYKSAGDDLCLKISLDSKEFIEDVDVNGTYSYDFTLEQSITLGGGGGILYKFSGCDFKDGVSIEKDGRAIGCKEHIEDEAGISFDTIFRQNDVFVRFDAVFEDGDESEGITLSKNSEDKVGINGNLNPINESTKADKVWWNDEEGPEGLYVEVNNVRLRITDVRGFTEDVRKMIFTFEIIKYEEGAEFKKIKYGLYYLKDDGVDCITGYNPEGKVEYKGSVQEEEYRIKVEPMPKAAE